MNKTTMTGIRKFMFSFSAAAVILAGTAVPSMTSAAAMRSTGLTPSINHDIDKEGIHIQTIAGLIRELPNSYSNFTASDRLTFNRTKNLMDDLSRDEMFRLLDSHEDLFNKYNSLYSQEKMELASK